MNFEEGEIYRDRAKNLYIVIYIIEDYKTIESFSINSNWDINSINNKYYDYDEFVNNINSAKFGRVGKLSSEKLAKLMLLRG